ncbi:MAG: hypothetical protein JXA61_08520, partial [Bacteroidales bacterium]|nr:hypothetical protein [Bacteroidales bacterium]
LKNFMLPVKLDLSPDKMIEAMKKDKKREGDFINMVLLDEIGHAFTYKIQYNQLKELLNDMC